MRDLENTKESIRVDALNEADRKKLFNDFKKAGGEVITDRSKKISAITSKNTRTVGKAYSLPSDRRSAPRAGSGNNKNLPKSHDKKNARSVKRGSQTMSFSQRFMLHFRLRIMKVCESGCMFFNRSFLNDLNGEYGNALLEIRLQFVDIFKKNLNEGKKVTELLDKQKELFYELIEMSADIYPQIFDNEFVFTNAASVVSIKEPLMQLHRKLFLLYSYENTLLNGWLKAIEATKNRDKEMYPTASVQRKKIGNALYSAFHRLYPRLHWLMCLYSKKYISIKDTRAIEDMLEILPVEKPGFYRAKKKKAFVEEPTFSQEPEAPKQEERQSQILDADINEGIQLLSNIDYKSLRKLFDPKGIYDFIDGNDKILIVYLLFTEFIAEYSFVLNTNKIKFSGLSENGLKTNYVGKLRDLYYEIDKIRQGFSNYADTVTAYNKINREKPYNESQYLSYSKRMQEAINKRNNVGKACRMAVKAYLERIRDAMQLLSDNVNGNGIIIQNSQETITMDGAVEGRKKLNGKKVYEVVHILKCFADACIYRMGPKGDLFGNADANSDYNKADASSPKTPPTEDMLEMERLEKIDESKSVLGQLNDIL